MEYIPTRIAVGGLLLLLAAVVLPSSCTSHLQIKSVPTEELPAPLTLPAAEEIPPAPIAEEYPVRNIRVIDGDTLVGDVSFTRAIPAYELPWQTRIDTRLETITYTGQRIRARNCDAMEADTATGQKAKISLQ